jgi:hypothetical protein
LSGLLFVTADGDGTGTAVDDDTINNPPPATDQTSTTTGNGKKGNDNGNRDRNDRSTLNKLSMDSSQDKDFHVEGSAVDIAVFHLVSTYLLQEIAIWMDLTASLFFIYVDDVTDLFLCFHFYFRWDGMEWDTLSSCTVCWHFFSSVVIVLTLDDEPAPPSRLLPPSPL